MEYDKNGVMVGKIVDGVQTIENSLQITPKLESNCQWKLIQFIIQLVFLKFFNKIMNEF